MRDVGVWGSEGLESRGNYGEEVKGNEESGSRRVEW